MADYFEIDFLGVETKKSGDAIAMRYSIDGVTGIHVVDGGYIDTGTQIVEHVKNIYGATHIDNVVLTHPDRDHANGLRKVLEECTVGTLWMNRPWEYAEQLLPRFSTYNSVSALERKLRELYSATAELESLANEHGVEIRAAFQGERIGPFVVLAPTYDRYLDCVVDSEKTPEAVKENSLSATVEGFSNFLRSAVSYVKSLWGEEYFPPGPTSSENEMSLVQYAYLNNKKILLTGDAGRDALQEAIDYAPTAGLTLPGISYFQVPHHGGRHNVSTEILDQILGKVLPSNSGGTTWNAICSSAKADEDHPRNSVVRAMIHRGGHFAATEGRTLCISQGISRAGWSAVEQMDYPEEQEN